MRYKYLIILVYFCFCGSLSLRHFHALRCELSPALILQLCRILDFACGEYVGAISDSARLTCLAFELKLRSRCAHIHEKGVALQFPVR